MFTKQDRREMDQLIRKAIDTRSALADGLNVRAAYILGARDGFRMGRMSYENLMNLFDAKGRLNADLFQEKKQDDQPLDLYSTL